MSEPTKEQIEEFKRLMKWYHEESPIDIVPLEFLRKKSEPPSNKENSLAFIIGPC